MTTDQLKIGVSQLSKRPFSPIYLRQWAKFNMAEA